MGDVIPFPLDHSRGPDEIQVGDFVFCSIECHARWFNEGRLGMS